MSFLPLLQQYQAAVERELQDYFQRKRQKYAETSNFTQNLIKQIESFTLRGGKRLRPALVYYTYKLLGGNQDAEIIRVSTFVEHLQSFLLIHDDIFDHAPLRRGESTFHCLYEEQAAGNHIRAKVHFGKVMGILGGCIANQFAYDVITNADLSDKAKIKIIDLLSEKTIEVLMGQALDFLLPYAKKYSMEDIYTKDMLKTVAYTTQIPIFAGAIMADSRVEQVRHLNDYAIHLGIAFQIRDDILGMYGDEAKVGKSASSDLREGKKTVLTHYAAQHADVNQKVILDKHIGNRNVTQAELETVREIIQQTGALDQAREKCVNHVTMGLEALDKIESKDGEAKTFLRELGQYIVERNK